MEWKMENLLTTTKSVYNFQNRLYISCKCNGWTEHNRNKSCGQCVRIPNKNHLFSNVKEISKKDFLKRIRRNSKAYEKELFLTLSSLELTGQLSLEGQNILKILQVHNPNLHI